MRNPIAVLASACAFLSLLSIPAGVAHAAGAVEMQVERIVVQAIGEYNDAMAAGDPAAWLKYFTEGVRRRAPQSEQDGKEAFDQYYRKEFEAFRAKWTTSKMIIAGRSAAVEFEWDAVHKASNAPVKINMVAVLQLAPNGKFDSVNFYFDSAKLAQYNVADAAAAR
jgi:ketosteroid isomerase-like protein